LYNQRDRMTRTKRAPLSSRTSGERERAMANSSDLAY
jgi:hypothetical protein